MIKVITKEALPPDEDFYIRLDELLTLYQTYQTIYYFRNRKSFTQFSNGQVRREKHD